MTNPTQDVLDAINQARRVLSDCTQEIAKELPRLSLATAYLRHSLETLELLRLKAVANDDIYRIDP